MRITDEVYLVGGGPTLAFGLTADPDCHVYLIDGGGELALIDCGLAEGDSLDRMAATIAAEGLDLARLSTLLVTHYHMDHAGGAARTRARFGVQVFAPAGAAATLRTGDERAVALDAAKRAGVYPDSYRFEPVAVDRELHEGDRVRIGDLEIEVFDTPGHCAGHCSFLLQGASRRYLFAGDAVFNRGQVVLQHIHDCDIPASAASVAKLAALDFDAFLPGHAGIALTGGKRHVEMAATAFANLFVPKNLV